MAALDRATVHTCAEAARIKALSGGFVGAASLHARALRGQFVGVAVVPAASIGSVGVVAPGPASSVNPTTAPTWTGAGAAAIEPMPDSPTRNEPVGTGAEPGTITHAW